MLKDYVFTSESVNEGHPDKVCDQISDAVLDALLAEDPDSRVACEALIKTGLVVIAGEITSNANVQFGIDIGPSVFFLFGLPLLKSVHRASFDRCWPGDTVTNNLIDNLHL